MFDDNPQVPYSALDLTFDGGPRAVIAAPRGCGDAGGEASYSPWSGQPAVAAPAAVTVTGCSPPAFAPGFGATVSDAGARRSGAFTASFSRPDGQEFLAGVTVALAPGLLATLKGVPRCSDAAASSGTCPAETRVGTAATKAGAGEAPLALSGPVYLTGPYGGAPFGMVTVIHAVAGPYDLGSVIVRQALHIDPTDAHVTVESDPLPQIVEGIPLRLREVALTIDRDGFMLNPTSCAPARVQADLLSGSGTPAAGAADVRGRAGRAGLALRPPDPRRQAGDPGRDAGCLRPLARGEAGTRRPQRQAAAHRPPARRRLQEAPLTDRNQVRGAARSRPGLQFFPPFV